MKKTMWRMLLGLGLTAFTAEGLAVPTNPVSSLVPQPTACITSTFTSHGNKHRPMTQLKLVNNCKEAMDFQNASVTFQYKIPLNTAFWGRFHPLPYPDNNLRITSQPSGTTFTANFTLHFPSYPRANTKLPVGKFIQVEYLGKLSDQIGKANVYLSEGNGSLGNLALRNTSAQPADVSQGYAMIHVLANGTNIADVQLPWATTKTLTGLAVGTYNIAAENVDDNAGNMYKGTAVPVDVAVIANQTVTSDISYARVAQEGMLAIQLQALPTEIPGYTEKPVVAVTETITGSSIPVALTWGESTTVAKLKAGATYNLNTPVINFNGVNCEPTFTPATLIASSAPVPVSNLTYTCKQVAQSKVTLNVSGAPTSLTSLKVTLTPNDGTQAVTQLVPLANGMGTASVTLTTGTIYTVSSEPVSGFEVKFAPQPLTAVDNAVESITLVMNP